MGQKPIALEERFWKHVKKGVYCWLWEGHVTSAGYGKIRIAGKGSGWVFAHRFSYEFHHGLIPKGKIICHRCDTKRCVKPSHIFLGTHQDNSDDAKMKGLYHSGERCSWSKLTEKEAEWIKANYKWGNGVKIAKKFHITPQAVHYIVKGRNWKRNSLLPSMKAETRLL